MTSGQLGLLTSLTALKLPWISHLFYPMGYFFLCLFSLTLHKSFFPLLAQKQPDGEAGQGQRGGMPCIRITSGCWQFLHAKQNWAGWQMLKETWSLQETLGFICTRPLSGTVIGLVLRLPCALWNQLSKQWSCPNAAHFHGIYSELRFISSSSFNPGNPNRTRCHKVFCCVYKSFPVFHSCSEKPEHLT